MEEEEAVIQCTPEGGHIIKLAVSSDASPDLEWPELLSFSLQLTPFLLGRVSRQYIDRFLMSCTDWELCNTLSQADVLFLLIEPQLREV